MLGPGILNQHLLDGVMFIENGQSQSPTCPKCQHALRLHARLAQADGFPEVRCLECTGCGEVVIVEQFLATPQPQAA
jgi:Na+-translocating ferredoxin:NAD+ oxidoreductase RNF subunit RnfB